MTRKEKAQEYFKQGYNCAQSVILAFKDELGKSQEELAMLGSSFGGGLARMREVCGAVSGGALVLGLLFGYQEPKDVQGKKEHYALVQDFAAKFKAEVGSVVCRELLYGGNFELSHNPPADWDKPDPAERTPGYYKKRPCIELVGLAADIIDDIVEKRAVAKG